MVYRANVVYCDNSICADAVRRLMRRGEGVLVTPGTPSLEFCEPFAHSFRAFLIRAPFLTVRRNDSTPSESQC